MPGSQQEVFAEVNRRLNESIRALVGAMEKGQPDAELLRSSRSVAEEGLSRLKGMERAPGPLGQTIPKVIEHLDIYRTLLDSCDAAPELSRKLVTHLLEEQVEISGEIARGGFRAGLPAAVGDEPQGPAAGRAAGLLPGGRRPLTVGSLIGR